jgi:PAS domain S-box-containing protein
MNTSEPPSAQTRPDDSTILHAILEASHDAIFIKNQDGRITLWSRGAERIYGYTAQEILGQSLSLLLPPNRQEEAEVILRRVIQGEPIFDYPTVRRTKSGTLLEVSVTAMPLRDDTDEIAEVLVIARDVTEGRRLAADAHHSSMLLHAVHEVALDILASRNGREALRRIAEAARTMAGAQYAALGVARPDGNGLAEFVMVGLTSEQEAEIGPLPVGKGILGHLLTLTEPLRIDVLADHPASSGFPPNHPPMTSFLGVPIRQGDKILGSLYLTQKEGEGGFSESDEIAVQALGAYAAVAIYNLQMQSHQRALVHRLIQAQEEERRQVAYDLHDGLTQFIMASHAHLEAFQNMQSHGGTERAERELKQCQKYLRDAVLESRRIINGLRALALEDLGLAGALEQILQEEKTRAGWAEVEFIHNISDQRFETFLEATTYRIAQEALTNARKHAQCQRVRVMLLLDMSAGGKSMQISLEIRDWGIGFHEEAQRDPEEHIGLSSMQERATLVGGTYHMQSVPGSGTTVRVSLPITQLVSKTDGGAENFDTGNDHRSVGR